MAHREIDDENPDPREYKASALCYVAGCEQATLRAWRRRNGLFPETMRNRTWNRFSLADMSAAKLVVDLTNAGVAAQRAVDIAMQLLPIIEDRSTRKPSFGPVPMSDAQRDDWVKAQCAVNFVVQGNSRGDLQITRYDQALTVEQLLKAEGHPGGLIIINLANVMDISLDRLAGVRDDEIDPEELPPKRPSRKALSARKAPASVRPKTPVKKRVKR